MEKHGSGKGWHPSGHDIAVKAGQSRGSTQRDGHILINIIIVFLIIGVSVLPGIGHDLCSSRRGVILELVTSAQVHVNWGNSEHPLLNDGITGDITRSFRTKETPDASFL